MSYKGPKGKAWKEFSRYIRLRDCLISTGTLTHGKCVTCKKTFPFKELQAGHCVPGRGNAILLHDEAVHAQCFACNAKHIGNGRHSEYALFMIDQYGRETLEEIQRLSRTAKPVKNHEWVEQAKYWKEKADGLKTL